MKLPAKYAAARRALALATSIDEIKDIRDKAGALKMYAEQAGDISLIGPATTLKVDAETKAGGLLIEMAQTGGRRSGRGDQRKAGLQAATPLLADLGINKTQSSRWQKLWRLQAENHFLWSRVAA